MSKNKRNSLDEEKKNVQTGKVQEGGAPKDVSSGAFQEDVWEADSAQSCCGKEKEKCATPEDESPLASITNWFNSLQLFNQDGDGDKKDNGPKAGKSGSNGGGNGGNNKGLEDLKEELAKNWKKYAIFGLVLLILFNVVWTLMDSRIGSVAEHGTKQAATVQELKKELEAVKATLADKVTAMDDAIKGAGAAIEGIQGSLAALEVDLKAFDERASDDRLVIARHDEYIRQTVADRKAELRKYAKDLRVYESLLGEGGVLSLPSVPMVAAAVMEESVGPVKSTLQLTQDSLSITRDTLAITRDSLEKTRADLLMREKDNAALTADLDSARRDLIALEAKVAELESKYKDQSLDLSKTKADLAVSEKETSDLKLEISKTQGSLREEIEKAKEALNEKGAEIESVQAALAERDEQVKALETKVAELEASISEKSEAISTLTEELEAVKADSVTKAQDLSEKSGLFETVQKELEELKASSETLKADFEKSMEEKEAKLSEAKAKIEELVEQLKETEGLSEKNVEEVEALKQALEMKQAELNEAIGSIRAHEERQKALEDKLMILEKEAPVEEKPAS